MLIAGDFSMSCIFVALMSLTAEVAEALAGVRRVMGVGAGSASARAGRLAGGKTAAIGGEGAEARQAVGV
jgi:hypothetical protein